MSWHAEQAGATLCAFVGGLCVLQVRSAVLLSNVSGLNEAQSNQNTSKPATMPMKAGNSGVFYPCGVSA